MGADYVGGGGEGVGVARGGHGALVGGRGCAVMGLLDVVVVVLMGEVGVVLDLGLGIDGTERCDVN